MHHSSCCVVEQRDQGLLVPQCPMAGVWGFDAAADAAQLERDEYSHPNQRDRCRTSVRSI
jgi:hypothetical protein